MQVSNLFMFCILIILIICGDIELNPGPKKNNVCNDYAIRYLMLLLDIIFLSYFQPVRLTMRAPLYVFRKHTWTLLFLMIILDYI